MVWSMEDRGTDGSATQLPSFPRRQAPLRFGGAEHPGPAPRQSPKELGHSCETSQPRSTRRDVSPHHRRSAPSRCARPRWHSARAGRTQRLKEKVMGYGFAKRLLAAALALGVLGGCGQHNAATTEESAAVPMATL